MNDDECSNMVVVYVVVYQAERARTEDQLRQQITELQQTRTQLQQRENELNSVQQNLQVYDLCTFYGHE